LLAIVNTSSIIGLDSAVLFPGKAASRDETYRKGRAALEAQGWLKPAPDYPGEYDLNPNLLEMISIIAAPEIVMATAHGQGTAKRRLVLHYLAGETIVELAAPEKGDFRLGLVAGFGALAARLAEMLALAGAGPAPVFSMDAESYEEFIRLLKGGKSEEAISLLDSSGDNGRHDRPLDTLARPALGRMLIFAAGSEEPEIRRKAFIYGQGGQAWMASRRFPEPARVELAACNPAYLEDVLPDWLKDLGDH
jgi:hypothetical protein